MNEATTVALSQLAAQLSTTAEHLWGVLIQQALVYGITSSITGVAIIVIATLLVRKCLTPGFYDLDRNANQHMAKTMATSVITTVAAAWMTLSAFLFVVFGFSSIITAFVNPEYWALTKVLAVVQ